VAFRFRVLGSGSTGNATLVEAEGTRILLDAGLGPRELAERVCGCGVDPASLAAVFLSHEHQDHARGAASFSRKWGVPLVGTRGTYAAAGLGAARILGYQVMQAGTGVEVGPLTVTGVATPHDAAEPLAFVVSWRGQRFGHATDFGHFSPAVVEAFRGCEAVLVESNYDPAMLRDGPYPWSLKERILSPRGHVSNADVAHYLGSALGAACRLVVLAHLSRTNNHPELAEMSAELALRRAGRKQLRLELTGPDGTGWLSVGRRAPPASAQLRLF